jgi:PAS domain-containing protein
MSPLETILYECGAAAGIGFWRFDAERGLLHWPRGFGPARDESYGSWWRLGDFGQFFEASDRTRLFDYYENLFAPENPPFTLEIPVQTDGRRIQLRIEGKQLRISEHLLAGGLVRDISRRADAEERAKSLTQILEAMLGTVHSGVIVLDVQGQVRKANRMAMDMFGVTLSGPIDTPAFHRLAANLPPSLQETAQRCRLTRARVEGSSVGASGLAEPLTWEANPWGRGGVVVVVRPEGFFGAKMAAVLAAETKTAGEAPILTPSAPPLLAGSAPAADASVAAAAVANSRALLEYVRHPCLIIQTRDATIDYANKFAREKLGIKTGVTSHVNNLFELTGRHPPRHVYVTADRFNTIVTLPMGARVARMNDIDPDLYFVEYS